MKLVDILARELKVWPEMPEGGTRLEQDINNAVIEGDGFGTVDLFILSERADDQKGAHVSKAEWQAAVEALKAEQADELKWPDGAEFMGTTGEGCPKVFYRNVGGDYEYRYERDTCWSKNMGKPSHVPLIPRPTERAVEWDGAGLPPDKCEVEFEHELCGWLRVKVVGFDGDLVVVRHQDEYLAVSTKLMRPIRTQEQIAAEERGKAIEEIAKATGLRARDGRTEVATAIYDAGYRKQVEELVEKLDIS